MRAKAWLAISGVSEWVMATIKWDYTLQFARRLPRFCGVLATAVHSKDTQVIRIEVINLLEKGAIEIIPLAQSESGFYSRSFLVLKKDGGLLSILDLRLDLANMPRGLFHVAGSERHLLSYPGSPSSQTILEIRSRRGGVSIQGPPIWFACDSSISGWSRGFHPQLGFTDATA